MFLTNCFFVLAVTSTVGSQKQIQCRRQKMCGAEETTSISQEWIFVNHNCAFINNITVKVVKFMTVCGGGCTVSGVFEHDGQPESFFGMTTRFHRLDNKAVKLYIKKKANCSCTLQFAFEYRFNDVRQCNNGAGCSWKNMSDPVNECKDENGIRIFKNQKCYNAGCSWCQRQTGWKCFKNPTSRDDMIIPPVASTENCIHDATKRIECEYLVKERSEERIHCAASGCHWCPLTGQPSCIQGQVCLTQEVNGEYDCRRSPTEVLTEYQCLQRSCSWCPNNIPFKCMREHPGYTKTQAPTSQRLMTSEFTSPTNTSHTEYTTHDSTRIQQDYWKIILPIALGAITIAIALVVLWRYQRKKSTNSGDQEVGEVVVNDIYNME